VIIAALIGIDCHPQMKHHMIGMLINGVTREEIESTRTLCYRAAKSWVLRFEIYQWIFLLCRRSDVEAEGFWYCLMVSWIAIPQKGFIRIA
jgi:hypothetical protein